MLSRRRLLELGISGSFGILAGCGRFRSSEQKPLRVSVTNVTDEPHQVDVAVSDNEEPLIEQQVEIAAATPNDGTVIHTVAWVESYPQTTTFRVNSTLDGDASSSNTVTIDCDSDFDGGNVIIRIHDDDRITISESCFSLGDEK